MLWYKIFLNTYCNGENCSQGRVDTPSREKMVALGRQRRRATTEQKSSKGRLGRPKCDSSATSLVAFWSRCWPKLVLLTEVLVWNSYKLKCSQPCVFSRTVSGAQPIVQLVSYTLYPVLTRRAIFHCSLRNFLIGEFSLTIFYFQFVQPFSEEIKQFPMLI